MAIRYDFAFSFAGEDRSIVDDIKKELTDFEIFYDMDHNAELCGNDLYQYLRNIYLNQAKYVVCFFSQSYRKKVWTNLEFAAVKERFMATFFASDFLIPIILDDDSMLQEIPAFIGYYTYKNTRETVSLLKEKYGNSINEDFQFENINYFKLYLLQEITAFLDNRKCYPLLKENTISFRVDSSEKSYYLVAENFLKLPCLLFYETHKKSVPIAIISWKRSERIFFSWNIFSQHDHNQYENITLNELIERIVCFLLSN